MQSAPKAGPPLLDSNTQEAGCALGERTRTNETPKRKATESDLEIPSAKPFARTEARTAATKVSRNILPEQAGRDVDNESAEATKSKLQHHVDSARTVMKTLGKSSFNAKLPAVLLDDEFASSSDEDVPSRRAGQPASPDKLRKAVGRRYTAAEDVRHENGLISQGSLGRRKSEASSTGISKTSRRKESGSPSRFKEVVVEIASPSKLSASGKRQTGSAPVKNDDNDTDELPSNRAKSNVNGVSSQQSDTEINAHALQRTPSRRQAASKATQKLHEDALDMNKYEKQKRSNNFRGDWEDSRTRKLGDRSQESKKRRQSGALETASDEDGMMPQMKRVKTEKGTSGKNGGRVSKAQRKQSSDSVDEESDEEHGNNAIDPSDIWILATQVILSDDIVKVCVFCADIVVLNCNTNLTGSSGNGSSSGRQTNRMHASHRKHHRKNRKVLVCDGYSSLCRDG